MYAFLWIYVAALRLWPRVNRIKDQFHEYSKILNRRKVTLWVAFSTCFFVFLINVILLILAYTTLNNNSPDNYVRDLYSGNCKIVERVGTGTHLVINLLSTLMLWASNLAMQLAVAPTREAVDKAHKNRTWLDIGIFSFRNFWSSPKANKTIWALLFLSSVPIHFLYNSVVFSALHTNSYQVWVVNERFFHEPFSNASIIGGTDSLPEFTGTDRTDCYNSLGRTDRIEPMLRSLNDFHTRPESYQNVSLIECLQNYSDPFTYRPNLFLVEREQSAVSNLCMRFTTEPTANWTVLDFGYRSPTDPHNFYSATLCDYTSFEELGFCDRLDSLTPSEMKENRTYGWPWQLPFNYCIYDHSTASDLLRPQSQCHLQCSPVLLLVVTIFNATKCLGILYVILNCDRRTLSTIGDAIASFLERPDEYTKGFGIATKRAIVNSRKVPSRRVGTVITWTRTADRWWNAADAGPWILSLVSLWVVIAGAVFFISDEIILQKTYHRDPSLRGLFKLGFGTARSEAIISWDQQQTGVVGLLENLLVANVWQFLVSILYLSFTVILTSQLVAREWAYYGTKEKFLRVSKPKGSQRSSYFVSMPYRYGLPIMIVFTAEHWLLSQSSFIIRLLLFDSDGSQLPGRTTSGFSPIPSLSALILTLVIFSSYIINSIFRRYPANPRMPLVGTNSLAISANCHPPRDDENPHMRIVRWGIPKSEHGQGDLSEPKTCTFTSKSVEPLDDDAEVLGLNENVKQGPSKPRTCLMKCKAWCLYLLRHGRQSSWTAFIKPKTWFTFPRLWNGVERRR